MNKTTGEEKEKILEAPPMPIPAPQKHKVNLLVWLVNSAVAYNNFVFELSDWIIVLCGTYMGFILITQFNQSNLTVGIALIAILIALGSSCFGYARAIDSKEDHREKIVFSGERLLHGAVLGILGAILKFIQANADKLPWTGSVGLSVSIFKGLVGGVSVTLFVAAVLTAITGLRLLSKTLQGLANNHSEWID